MPNVPWEVRHTSRAANGLAIPYVGYLKLDVELCGALVPQCGVLVIKDTPGGVSSQVLGILGMNIIHRCSLDSMGWLCSIFRLFQRHRVGYTSAAEVP